MDLPHPRCRHKADVSLKMAGSFQVMPGSFCLAPFTQKAGCDFDTGEQPSDMRVLGRDPEIAL